MPRAFRRRRVGHDVLREELLQYRQITGPRRVQEHLQQAPARGAADRFPAFRGQTPAGTGHQLARVGLAGLQDLRDAAVRVDEGFPQHVGGAFHGIQLLEQEKDGQAERLRPLGSGSQGPVYDSRRILADWARLIASRAVTVERKAAGSSIPARSVLCQRTHASWRMSSASAALPSTQ